MLEPLARLFIIMCGSDALRVIMTSVICYIHHVDMKFGLHCLVDINLGPLGPPAACIPLHLDILQSKHSSL
jgi:hypothetical protein